MWAFQEQRTVSNQNPTIPEPSSQIPVIPSSLPAPAMSAAEEQDPSAANSRRHVSCMPCFDALWFCYSPVHQLQQYYRLGALDNCSKKWSDLLYCLNLKTKSSSEVQEWQSQRSKNLRKYSLRLCTLFMQQLHRECQPAMLEILEAREKTKPHIWSFRTREESAVQWQKWYEHLDKPE